MTHPKYKIVGWSASCRCYLDHLTIAGGKGNPPIGSHYQTLCPECLKLDHGTYWCDGKDPQYPHDPHEQRKTNFIWASGPITITYEAKGDS